MKPCRMHNLYQCKLTFSMRPSIFDLLPSKYPKHDDGFAAEGIDLLGLAATEGE